MMDEKCCQSGIVGFTSIKLTFLFKKTVLISKTFKLKKTVEEKPTDLVEVWVKNDA